MCSRKSRSPMHYNMWETGGLRPRRDPRSPTSFVSFYKRLGRRASPAFPRGRRRSSHSRNKRPAEISFPRGTFNAHRAAWADIPQNPAISQGPNWTDLQRRFGAFSPRLTPDLGRKEGGGSPTPERASIATITVSISRPKSESQRESSGARVFTRSSWVRAGQFKDNADRPRAERLLSHFGGRSTITPLFGVDGRSGRRAIKAAHVSFHFGRGPTCSTPTSPITRSVVSRSGTIPRDLEQKPAGQAGLACGAARASSTNAPTRDLAIGLVGDHASGPPSKTLRLGAFDQAPVACRL